MQCFNRQRDLWQNSSNSAQLWLCSFFSSAEDLNMTAIVALPTSGKMRHYEGGKGMHVYSRYRSE